MGSPPAPFARAPRNGTTRNVPASIARTAASAYVPQCIEEPTGTAIHASTDAADERDQVASVSLRAGRFARRSSSAAWTHGSPIGSCRQN